MHDGSLFPPPRPAADPQVQPRAPADEPGAALVCAPHSRNVRVRA